MAIDDLDRQFLLGYPPRESAPPTAVEVEYTRAFYAFSDALAEYRAACAAVDDLDLIDAAEAQRAAAFRQRSAWRARMDSAQTRVQRARAEVTPPLPPQREPTPDELPLTWEEARAKRARGA